MTRIALVQQHAGRDREDHLRRGLAALDPARARDSHARRLFLRDRGPELYPDWAAPHRERG